MNYEREEALKVAAKINDHLNGPVPCGRCRRLAAALLEMRAAGILYGTIYIFSDSTKHTMALQARRLRREAKQLREAK